MLRTVIANELQQMADALWLALHDNTWRSLLILTVTALLLFSEASRAKLEGRASVYRQSYTTNFGALLFNDTLLSLLSVTSLWTLAGHFAGWGLLSAIQDTRLKALLAFVLLDLTLYLWHRANHQFGWLWRYHKVHHGDRVMNVSTAFRLHCVEVFLTVAVKALFIVVVGVEAPLVVASEVLITLCVLFHHGHITFRGERWLGRLAITPYLHRTHHSTVRAEHDSNYGAVFSCWDRLFGTWCEAIPADIGLRNVPGQNLLELIRFGFAATAPTVPTSEATRPLHWQEMIAEAAYYLAEKRGFTPGDAVRDWFEAERQLRSDHTQN